MKITKERQGELFILGGAVLWGFFPVITILSYQKLSPLVSLAISSGFAALYFAVFLSIKKKWYEVGNRSALKDILFATFFIGILYYLFFFFGLQVTSAGNASIVALTEVFFSFLLFHVIKKDTIPTKHLLGAALMIIGALIVLYPNFQGLRTGDLLILAAAFVAPFGNLFARRAREKVSTDTIMFIRSSISFLVLLLVIFVSQTPFSVTDINVSLFFLLINGVFLLGLSKTLWIEGIHRINVTKANALSSLSPLLTLFFAWLFLHNTPTPWQFLSFIPIFFGILLLGSKKSS